MKTNITFSQSLSLNGIHHQLMKPIFILALFLVSLNTSKAQLAPCYANISWTQDAQNPFLYHFCDASEFAIGAYGFGFSWELGDGSTSTDSCFDHLFTSAGEFAACITVHACDPNYGGASCSDDTCITISVGGKGGNDTTTMVQSLSSGEVYGVYPNPVTHSAFVQFHLNENAPVNISIFNIQGKKIYAETKDEVAGNHSELLNEEFFPAAGIYFVQVATDKGTNKVMVLSKK